MSRLAVLLAVLAAGCARVPETGTVRGRVTADGVPLTAGSVLFETTHPRWATIAIVGPDGGYEVTGVPVGPVRIGVRTRGVRRFDAAGDGEPVRTPRRFEDPATSGMEFEVFPGEQVLDIRVPAE